MSSPYRLCSSKRITPDIEAILKYDVLDGIYDWKRVSNSGGSVKKIIESHCGKSRRAWHTCMISGLDKKRDELKWQYVRGWPLPTFMQYYLVAMKVDYHPSSPLLGKKFLIIKIKNKKSVYIFFFFLWSDCYPLNKICKIKTLK